MAFREYAMFSQAIQTRGAYPDSRTDRILGAMPDSNIVDDREPGHCPLWHEEERKLVGVFRRGILKSIMNIPQL